jgi:hypothetical protein
MWIYITDTNSYVNILSPKNVPFAHFFRGYSFKEHTELAAINLTIASGHIGHFETAPLQAFKKYHEPISIPIHKFDHAATTVYENE